MATIFRVEKSTNYTVMSNYHLDDARLSLKAIGLLSKILRMPDGWDYSIEGLSRICREGKAAIRSAIEELEEAGYIVRRQTHGEGGQFAGNEYIVYEQPHFDAEKSPSCENRTTVEESPLCGFPMTENPSTENPSSENRTQINTILANTIPPKAPQGGRRRREPKKAPDWEPERFAAFWAYYPRGESKHAAIAAWDKLRPSSELIDEMARALKRQTQTEEWQRGVGIPYASTWLNQRRWEDEQREPNPPADDEGSLPLWT